MPVRHAWSLTSIHRPFRIKSYADIRFLQPLLKRLRFGDELRSTWLEIEQQHGAMLRAVLW
jgi:hypothetical protein